MAKFDFSTARRDPKLGWYEIGGKVFWDKTTALIEGSRLNLGYKDLHWNFNDQQFSQFDWTVEPSGDLRSFYHARARDLREKYDYLLLHFSGGSDSSTVLNAFLDQGLFIDEVMYHYAGKATSRFAPTKAVTHAHNEFSEYEFAAKPALKHLSTVSPHTKITIHDFTDDVVNPGWDENFIYWTGDYLTPNCIVRYNTLTQADQLRELDKGKKVGVIFGIDKPKIIAENGQAYLIFADRTVHTVMPALVSDQRDNFEIELFYWSPDAVPMIIKQAHVMKNWFEHPMNRAFRFMLDIGWQRAFHNRTTYEAITRPVIYPDYDLSTFQCAKPSRAVYQEWDFWMKDHVGTDAFRTFMQGLMYVKNNVHDDFMKLQDLPGANNSPVHWEYKSCPSKKYLLGALK